MTRDSEEDVICHQSLCVWIWQMIGRKESGRYIADLNAKPGYLRSWQILCGIKALICLDAAEEDAVVS